MTFSIDDALTQAQRLTDRGETKRARQLYQAILVQHPENAQTHAALADLENRLSRLNALSALLEKGEFSTAIEHGDLLAEQFPDSVMLHNFLGIAHASLAQPKRAITHFAKALSVRPDMAEIHVNLGKALSSTDQKQTAVASFLRALKLRPDYADAYFSLGVVLGSMARHQEAADSFLRALKLRPNFPEAEINLGNALRELGRFDEAIDCFNRALKLNRNSADIYVHLATVHNLQKRYPEAIAALDTALKIAPGRSDACALKLFLAATLCDWGMLGEEAAAIPALGLTGKAVPPFMLLALDDDPASNRTRAERLTQERYTLPEFEAIARPPTQRPRLRLGYFSADFHDHAVLFQLIRVLELHDRNAFEIFAYSYGPVADSAMQRRARRAVDTFKDVRNLSAKEIAQLARRDHIDIAIDLMGHTRNGRLEIFAHRAAPVQITYLGYPGTSGGPFIDYLVADQTIIPDEQRAHYTEKIIFLPHSYMPADNTKPIAEESMARRDMDLPENGFIFCCFNNSYKVSATEFDIWMHLLHRVEGSVLWLAGTNGIAEQNLVNETRKRGIDPARVIFTKRIEMAEHLARHRLADLFLDTFHYTGHATAADALWAGLPVLTRPGLGFQARVAASLLTAIGLPDLIAETTEDYERLALELALNPDRLAAIKQRLHENRAHMPLFDTERFTKNLEDGYRKAYRRWLEGEAPDDIVLQDGA